MESEGIEVGGWGSLQNANGLPAEISEACDLRVTIPMHAGIESLNASVAGSILLYEMVARLGFGTPSHD